MARYFFDFDDVPDEHGITMTSPEEAFDEALASMPEYVADLLSSGSGRSEMTCSIRDNDGAALYKITLTMRVENAAGEMIQAPFRL